MLVLKGLQSYREIFELITLDFYSFNPLSLIPGSFPNNMVESIKLKTPDPYVKPKSFWVKELELSEKKYCGIKIESHEANHEFKSFNSQKDLLQQGFLITHKGACGTCSSVQDLKVYLDRPNLTSPVRRCGALSFKWPVIQCLRRLGFSEPCSETWYYNIVQTRKKCARVCLQSWWKNEGFNQEDGALNACLACDENESGPAFKVTAGRTRRRSGIQSAIKRMEHEFFRLSHEYLESLNPKK